MMKNNVNPEQLLRWSRSASTDLITEKGKCVENHQSCVKQVHFDYLLGACLIQAGLYFHTFRVYAAKALSISSGSTLFIKVETFRQKNTFFFKL